MPHQHVDRPSSIDASVLHREGLNSHIQLGGVLVFEGPPPELPTSSITSEPGCIWPLATGRSAQRQPPTRDLGDRSIALKRQPDTARHQLVRILTCKCHTRSSFLERKTVVTKSP